MENHRICKHQKFGFCKFRNNCRNKHLEQDCNIANCDVKKCQRRHPKRCKFFAKQQCTFGESCMYKHDKDGDPKSTENSKLIDNLLRLVKTNSEEIVALKAEIEEKETSLKKQADEIEALKLETEGRKTEEKKKIPKKTPKKSAAKKIRKKTSRKKLPPKALGKTAEGASKQLEFEATIEEQEETIDLLIDEKEVRNKRVVDLEKHLEDTKSAAAAAEWRNSELVNICRNMKEEIKALKTETGRDTNGNLTAKLKKTTEDLELKTKELEKTVNAKNMLEKQLGIEIADRAKAEAAAIRERIQREKQLKKETKMNRK